MAHVTQAQAIQQISAALRSFGLYPVEYDVLGIADEYRMEMGSYAFIDDNLLYISNLAKDHKF